VRSSIALRWGPVLGVILVLGLGLVGAWWPGGGWGAGLFGGLGFAAFALVWVWFSTRVDRA
jgi:hypothetical protein